MKESRFVVSVKNYHLYWKYLGCIKSEERIQTPVDYSDNRVAQCKKSVESSGIVKIQHYRISSQHFLH